MGFGLPQSVTRWVAQGAILVTLAATTITYTTLQKTLVIDQDGELSQVQFYGDTVADALTAGNVELSKDDQVFPANSDRVASGDTITVRKASTEIRASRSDDFVREALEERVAKDITVSIDGQEINTVTFEATVRDVLIEMGVVLQEGDTLSVDPATAATAGLEISVGRASTDSLSVSETLKFDVVERKDNTLAKGERKIIQKGQVGEAVSTFHLTLVDDQESGRELLSRHVVTEPRSEIIAIGTKVAPAAPSNAGSGIYAGSGDVWSKLAKCESGGRPGVVSASGRYHGLYQFSVQTWRSVGGTGLPSQASPEEQTKRAKILQARSGWGQWPSCSRQIGVR